MKNPKSAQQMLLDSKLATNSICYECLTDPDWSITRFSSKHNIWQAVKWKKESGFVKAQTMIEMPTLKACVQTLKFQNLISPDAKFACVQNRIYRVAPKVILYGERGRWSTQFGKHHPLFEYTQYQPLGKQFQKTRLLALQELHDFLIDYDKQGLETWFWHY